MAPTKGGLSAPFDPSAAPVAREPMREEAPAAVDHLQRAALRMAELHGYHGDEILDSGQDKYYIAPTDIPPGWDYQWKRFTLLGKEDPAYQTQLARAGWLPVKTGMLPHYMPDGTPKDAAILVDGMILMERPLELTRTAMKLEMKRAREQVQIKEQQLSAAPPGQFERDNKGASMASINKTHAPMPVHE